MVMGMISPTESMTEIAYGVTRDTSVALGVSTMTNAALLRARIVAWLQELRVRMECDRRAGDGSALSGRL